MKKIFAVLAGLVVAYALGTASALVTRDGGPLPMCPPSKPCCSLQPPTGCR